MTATAEVEIALRDIESTDDIEHLVNTFYDQALDDPVIGFFFTDIAQIDLQAHLPKMYRFWSALILGLPTYQGNAFLPHAEIAAKSPLEAKHFARWLKLFFGTLDDHFEGPNVELAKKRAQHIATALSAKLAAQQR
tara:strand:+ start:1396 stop:1803 length:408 start_codon:yes stop_codon:yes gene_type:complete